MLQQQRTTTIYSTKKYPYFTQEYLTHVGPLRFYSGMWQQTSKPLSFWKLSLKDFEPFLLANSWAS
jgi:hypothetical protein